MKSHLKLAIFAAAALTLASCQTQQLPTDEANRSAFPKPTRYGEFDRAPTVLLGESTEYVVGYLEQFKPLADTGENESVLAPRTIRVADKDRIMTVDLAAGVCREIEIVGRHGDSILPKVPDHFESVLTAYAGNLGWVLEKEEIQIQAVEFVDGEGGIRDTPVGGERTWLSLDGTATAEVSWRFDNPGVPDHGDYRLRLKL
ncbi:MAG: hypothetical protein ACI8UO_001960 [Verrucomicrobiales bacterium]|jgi:hypothetical protein